MIARTLVLDFSGFCADEGLLPRMQERGIAYRCEDLRALEGTVCYCDDVAADALRTLARGAEERIRWIDTGDYHYVSLFFCECLREPFSLLLLDHHPDDQAPAFPGVLSCGSWVKVLREEVPALKEVYWNTLPAVSEGDRLYISLDKDLLCRDDARTGWTQGDWTLPRLKDFLRDVAATGAGIVGIDVCGGLPTTQGATPEDHRINCQTDIELQEFIITLLK